MKPDTTALLILFGMAFVGGLTFAAWAKWQISEVRNKLESYAHYDSWCMDVLRERVKKLEAKTHALDKLLSEALEDRVKEGKE